MFSTSINIIIEMNFKFRRLVDVHVVHPYSSMEASAAWKKCSCTELDVVTMEAFSFVQSGVSPKNNFIFFFTISNVSSGRSWQTCYSTVIA